MKKFLNACIQFYQDIWTIPSPAIMPAGDAPKSPGDIPSWAQTMVSGGHVISDNFANFVVESALRETSDPAGTIEEAQARADTLNCPVLAMRHLKNSSSWHHEMVQVEFVGDNGKPFYLNWDRTNLDQFANSKKEGYIAKFPQVVQGAVHSAGTKWGAPMLAKDTMRLTTTSIEGQTVQPSTRTELARSIEFYEGHGPTVLDVICTVTAHCRSYPLYNLHTTMCYWLAGSTFDDLVTRTQREHRSEITESNTVYAGYYLFRKQYTIANPTARAELQQKQQELIKQIYATGSQVETDPDRRRTRDQVRADFFADVETWTDEARTTARTVHDCEKLLHELRGEINRVLEAAKARGKAAQEAEAAKFRAKDEVIKQMDKDLKQNDKDLKQNDKDLKQMDKDLKQMDKDLKQNDKDLKQKDEYIKALETELLARPKALGEQSGRKSDASLTSNRGKGR